MTYATSPRSSPPSKRASTIFCDTCLNNQRLFTASIAQYLPDDPDAPDYAAREKDYYKFRKRMEKIYPQICADCEPKVRQKLEQAEYNAKADVLRHMIDQTKANRTITRRSWLDVFHQVGRWLWMAGFAAQIVSHILAVSALGLEYCATQEDRPWACSLTEAVTPPIIGHLLDHGRFLGWSFYAGMISCWWNPRFVKTVRGLTKNLVGLPNWYVYQAMAVGIRLIAMRFLTHRPTTAAAGFGVHLLLLALSLIVSNLPTHEVYVL
jgi:Ima1-like protein